MPKARRPIRRISEKKQRDDALIAAMRKDVMARDGRCRAHLLGLVPDVKCWGPTDMDHLKSRGRGGTVVSMDNVIALCRAHHIWKDDHPIEANEVGLWPHSWESEGL